MQPVNLADVPAGDVDRGGIRFSRRRLARAAGSKGIGCSLFEVPPNVQQMPVHVHGDEEEIFYVLSGSGLSWQDGDACEVGPGDAVVHRAGGRPHTFLSGDGGLELLAFGSGSETHLTWLPRAGVMWAGPRWVPLEVTHPFDAEGAAGPLERPQPTQRPANVAARDAVEPEASRDVDVRRLGAAGGSEKAGLNHIVLPPGRSGAPAHCHALEEELFVVLDGGGTLRLGEDEHPLNAGDVVARPPATGVPHQLTAGDDGMTYLAYGTRVAGDSTYYPQAGKVRLRGLGITIDV